MTLQIQLLDKINLYNIPVAKVHDSVKDPVEFINYVRGLKNVEGFVIAWDSGYRVKTKADEYLRFHKTKDGLSQEKNVIDLLVNDKVDDAKSYMMDDDRHRVEQFEDQFWHGFNYTVDQLEQDLKRALSVTRGDRKTFALGMGKDMQPIARQVMFSCWDGARDVRTELLSVIKKNIGTATKVDGVRHLWGGHRWSYHFEGDA